MSEFQTISADTWFGERSSSLGRSALSAADAASYRAAIGAAAAADDKDLIAGPGISLDEGADDVTLTAYSQAPYGMETTIPRHAAMGTSIAVTSGVLKFSYFTASRSASYTQVAVITGGTAAAPTPSLVRLAVYREAPNGDLTALASTANDTSLLAAANTRYVKSLQSPATLVAGVRYAIGLLVVTSEATPTLVGVAAFDGTEIWRPPRLYGQQSGRTDLPGSVSVVNITGGTHNPYLCLLP